jgi:hypothetical protein
MSSPGQGQHLLLTTRQSAGKLAQALAQDREQRHRLFDQRRRGAFEAGVRRHGQVLGQG